MAADLQSNKGLLIGIVVFSILMVAGLAGYYHHLINSQIGKASEVDDEYKELNESHALLRQKFEELIQSNEELTGEVDNLQQAAQTFQEEKRTILGQIQNSMAGLEQEKNKSQKEIAAFREELAQLENQNIAIKEELASTEKSADESKSNLTTEIKDLETRIKTYEGQVDLLENDIRQKNSTQGVPAMLHYNLGNFYFRNRRFSEAAEEYRLALSYQPDDADSHFNLAITYEQYLHDSLNAIVHFKRFLALKPDSSNAKQVREKILDLEFREVVLLGEPWDHEELSPRAHVLSQESKMAKNYKTYK